MNYFKCLLILGSAQFIAPHFLGLFGTTTQSDDSPICAPPPLKINATEWQLIVMIALTAGPHSYELVHCLLNATLCREGEDPFAPLSQYLDLSPDGQQRVQPLNMLLVLPNNTLSWVSNSSGLALAREAAFKDIESNMMEPCGVDGYQCGHSTMSMLEKGLKCYYESAREDDDDTYELPGPVKIALITDYIDRDFARLRYDDLQMVMNMDITFYVVDHYEHVANYYYYLLGKLFSVQMLHSSAPLGVPFVTPLQNLTQSMSTHWHLIYMLALSTNVTASQFDSIKRSISEPFEAYMQQHPDSVEVWTISSCLEEMGDEEACAKLSKDRSGNLGEYLANDVNLAQVEININFDLWHTWSGLSFASMCYNRQLGGRLPHQLDLDVDLAKGKCYLQKRRPRVYLITDYAEEALLSMDRAMLMPDLMMEFHIYALNNATLRKYKDYYRDTATLFDYDVQNPRPILIAEPKTNPGNVSRAALAIFIVLVLTVLIAALCFAAFFYRRKWKWIEKVNWLHAHHQRTSEIAKAEKADPWELCWDRLVLKELIGDGAFGQVHRAILIDLNEEADASKQKAREPTGIPKIKQKHQVAVKVLSICAADVPIREFVQEIEMMKLLPHNAHLVNMVGCVSKGPRPCLVMEYCANGTLLARVRQLKAAEGAPPEKQFAMFAWQICAGMHFLHRLDVIHRDLAARNVLLDAQNKVKIGDFGLCVRVPQHARNAPGSGGVFVQNILPEAEGRRRRFPVYWLALECLRRYEFSTKSDCWSFGVLLFEMHSFGQTPFAGIGLQELLAHLEQGNRLPRPEGCPDKMWETMQRCWTEAPEQRPEFEELLQTFTSLLEGMTEQYGYLDLVREKEGKS